MYGEWAEHEVQSISNHINSSGDIIDVGANIGALTMAYASRFPRSIIHSFEPSNFLYNLLNFNVVSNGFTNVRTYLSGCGADQEISIRSSKRANDLSNFGANSLLDNANQSCFAKENNVVVICRLDDIFENEQISFIKIDVEGMEPDVIDGANSLIDRCRPLLFVEASALDTTNRVIKKLLSKDYRLYWHQTSAFNGNNFNSFNNNVWSQLEMGILGVPLENHDNPPLPPLLAEVDAIPIFHPADYVFFGDRYFRANFHDHFHRSQWTR
jgi:FkbM family methyltransferase